MRQGNWVPIDKRLVNLLPKDRAYTVLEAMISYSIDHDNGHQGSINGYATLWGWSRVKTRRFLRTIEQGLDYHVDGHETGHKTGKRQAVRFILNKLQDAQDRDVDTHLDTHVDTTIDPEPSILNPKVNVKGIFHDEHEKSSIPLSFDAYCKKFNIEDSEAKDAINYFLDRYKKQRREIHRPLRPETWEHVLNTILFSDDDQRTMDFDYDDLKVMIDKYFQTSFEDCDYSICHFNTEGIKMRRFYEELY
ncbi:MAG: hypothetical protein PHU49_03625 [Syntrophorhabdaceae bacterium]|nr:hypothetical protein [Syntrophorhabdaceae bacterium]MDD5243085.1 hypothetical protein [Syntrophorhabdaceae bacterium]